jgi:hypothetical protein
MVQDLPASEIILTENTSDAKVTPNSEFCWTQMLRHAGGSKSICAMKLVWISPRTDIPQRCEFHQPHRRQLRTAGPVALKNEPALFLEVLVKKRGDFCKGFAGFRHAIIAPVLRVRLAFKDLQEGVDAQVAQFAMHPHGVA